MSDTIPMRIFRLRGGESGRGRRAETPARIPWRGWKDILLRLYDEIFEDRISTIAAGTAFFILLSLVPALGALVALYGLVADPATINQHLSDLRGFLPEAMLDLLGAELTRLEQQRTSLGVGFAVSLLITLWSANSGMKALFDAMNVAYEEEEKRGFLELLAISALSTIGGLAFFVLALNVVVGIPVVIAYFPLGPAGNLLISIVPAIVLFLVAVTGLALLYRYGPSRAQARWQWVTPGSLVAAFVWVIASALFSFYLSRFANYSATYGSLGAVVGVMMWIYISLFIVLVGAELNAEIERQTARDTTTGPEMPLGSRGAAMADEVGEARA